MEKQLADHHKLTEYDCLCDLLINVNIKSKVYP